MIDFQMRLLTEHMERMKSGMPEKSEQIRKPYITQQTDEKVIGKQRQRIAGNFEEERKLNGEINLTTRRYYGDILSRQSLIMIVLRIGSN